MPGLCRAVLASVAQSGVSLRLQGAVPGLWLGEVAERQTLCGGAGRELRLSLCGPGHCAALLETLPGWTPTARGPWMPMGHLSLRGGSPEAQGHTETALRQLPARSTVEGTQRGPGDSGRWAPRVGRVPSSTAAAQQANSISSTHCLARVWGPQGAGLCRAPALPAPLGSRGRAGVRPRQKAASLAPSLWSRGTGS